MLLHHETLIYQKGVRTTAQCGEYFCCCSLHRNSQIAVQMHFPQIAHIMFSRYEYASFQFVHHDVLAACHTTMHLLFLEGTSGNRLKLMVRENRLQIGVCSLRAHRLILKFSVFYSLISFCSSSINTLVTYLILGLV